MHSSGRRAMRHEPGESAVWERVAVVVVAVATLWVHWSALGGWWLWDDAQIVAHAQRFRWFDALVEPEAWRWLSRANFTPMVAVSFELDLWLAQLSPRGYYLHQVTVIVVVAVALFFFLRGLGVSKTASLMLSIFFVGSPPAAECVRALMTRHYLEGAALFLMAANVWTRAQSRGSLTIAAVLALLATLSKELYVPLVVGLLGLDWLNGRRHRQLAVRAGVVTLVALAYSVWRLVMLGGLGGYGDGIRGGELRPIRILTMLTGAVYPAWWLASLAGVGILAFLLVRRWRLAVTGATILAVLAVLPLVPVLPFPFTRYFLVAMLLMAVLLGLAERWIGGYPFRAMLALLMVGSVGAGVELSREIADEGRIWRGEGEWILAGPPSPTLFTRSHTLHLHGLQTIYGRELVNPVWLSPVVVDRPGLSYSKARRPIALYAPPVEVRTIDPSEVRLELSREGGIFRWSIDPGEEEWFYMSSPYGELFPFKSTGWLRWPTGPWPPTLEGEGAFRFAVKESKRSWAVTPVLPLPGDGEVVRWGELRK